jgi:hypothetical protein
MKLHEPKGRYSTRRIVTDEEKSRLEAYDLYIDVHNLKYLRDTLPKVEEFFQKPKIGETQSSSKNPRLRSLGTNAKWGLWQKEEDKEIKRQRSISQHELIP